MTERRPRLYADSRTPLPLDKQVATAQRGLSAAESDISALDDRVTAIEADLIDLPDPAGIWSSDRPESVFGTGTDQTWTDTGDGTSVTFPITGRISLASTRYHVMVGGVLQAPNKYAINTPAETLTFVAPPPNGLQIYIFAPFYGE